MFSGIKVAGEVDVTEKWQLDGDHERRGLVRAFSWSLDGGRWCGGHRWIDGVLEGIVPPSVLSGRG